MAVHTNAWRTFLLSGRSTDDCDYAHATYPLAKTGEAFRAMQERESAGTPVVTA